jgi:serine/threonine protein kinase/tetratricopeptide (TPR) repeat protein
MTPGSLIDGRFEIEGLAGAGGMGEVFRARDRSDGAAVALKVQGGAASQAERARFDHEATLLSGLHHPGIVRYVAHGASEGRRYLAMEWLEGEDLERRLRRGALDVRDAIALGGRVAEALGLAHAQGIVHRDLKPSNLFLVGGEVSAVKIIDFGIARLRWAERSTHTGTVLGTPGYMAPEQVRGKRELDARVDVFALGAILYECLAGAPVFQAIDVMALLVKILVEQPAPLGERCPEAPHALEHLVARMLAKEPDGRPANAAAVGEALRAIRADLDAPAANRKPAPRALTRDEQRILSVVLLGPPPSTDPAAITVAITDLPTLPHDGVTVDRSTTRREQAPSETLEETIARRGGQLRVLEDGSVAVALVGGGLATDQAARAAASALALRERFPDRPAAIATGRSEIAWQRSNGEAIERAARMIRARSTAMRAPGPMPIDLDEVTAGLLDQRFDVAAARGGFELLGERAEADATRTLLGRPTPFVGREREIATLEAVFDECTGEPAARAVVVTAPAGVGKSRLRHELMKRIARRGPVQVWAARGDPMRAGAPFGLVAEIVRREAQLLDGDPPDVKQQKLLDRVARRIPAADRDRVAAFLGELAGAPFPDEARVQLRAARQDPMLMGDQMRRAWVDLVRAECEEEPLVLVLEDLHWGDPPSVDLVDAALRLLADRPLMVLALARPEAHDVFPRLWAARSSVEVRLGELPRRACERLVRGVLGDGPPAAEVRALCERSSGNAFFLEELVRAAAEGRRGALPETVLAMVQSRLEGLDPEDRRLLRAASVFGEVFWRGGLALLLGARPADLDERLARLEEREWIAARPDAKIRDEREHGFRHALHREAAYGTLTAEDRALGHRLAGGWLEEAGETDAMALAGHFERGGEHGKAVRFYLRAAEQALEGNDLAGVVGRVDRAIACGASGEALGELARIRAEAHNWRGEHVEAARWARQAVDTLPPGSARWYKAVSAEGWAVAVGGDVDRLQATAEMLRTTLDDAFRAGGEALVQHVSAATLSHDWALFVGLYPVADALAGALDALRDRLPKEPEVHAAIARMSSVRAYYHGDIPEACAQVERAIARFEEAGDLRQAFLLRGNVAYFRSQMGADDEAAAVQRALLADAERMGLSAAVTAAKSNLGLSLARLGELDEAAALEVAAAAESAAQGNLRIEGTSRSYLAEVLLRRGDLDAAEAEARRSLELLADAAPLLPQALAILARVLLARGRVPEALARAEEAARGLEALGQIEEGESLVRLVHAEALDAGGDRGRARAAIASARERLLARADKIADPAWRRRFLEGVAENARTLALADAWS